MAVVGSDRSNSYSGLRPVLVLLLEALGVSHAKIITDIREYRVAEYEYRVAEYEYRVAEYEYDCETDHSLSWTLSLAGFFRTCRVKAGHQLALVNNRG